MKLESGELICNLKQTVDLQNIGEITSDRPPICDKSGICFEDNAETKIDCTTSDNLCKKGSYCENTEDSYKCTCFHGPPICEFLNCDVSD